MNVRIKSNVVDILGEKIYPAEIVVQDGIIHSITSLSQNVLFGSQNDSSTYILPGFIDAHVHIESSMLIPSEFARLAVPHGTVATVSDPHEIANVCGIAGVEFMIENSNQFRFISILAHLVAFLQRVLKPQALHWTQLPYQDS